MKKNVVLHTFIKDVIDKNKELTYQEILNIAQNDILQKGYNEKQIYNYLYNLRRKGEICLTIDGKYYFEKDNFGKKEIRNISKHKFLKDYDDFEVIEPSPHRMMHEVLSVMDTGMIAANPALLNHFTNYNAEIRLKRDCTEILLVSNGEKMTCLGKLGRVKNYNLVEIIKKANMKLPLYYVGTWDEEQGIWHGKYFPYNPNKGKKVKQK